ncbi:MAG: hypothetical protein OXH38_00560, partial [Chloroflexi bacterium]|nr:hypothetical protein [Chloroflexota bacterium]
MASADVERVEGWFREGELLHPCEGDAPPSTVDLARAIASIGGVLSNLRLGVHYVQWAVVVVA